MTDRYAGFVVVLERDIREDDAEQTIAAIRQIRGVLSVEPVLASHEVEIAMRRVRIDLESKIWKALREDDDA